MVLARGRRAAPLGERLNVGGGEDGLVPEWVGTAGLALAEEKLRELFPSADAALVRATLLSSNGDIDHAAVVLSSHASDTDGDSHYMAGGTLYELDGTRGYTPSEPQRQPPVRRTLELSRKKHWSPGDKVAIDAEDGIERARVLGPATSGDSAEMEVLFADGVIDDWPIADFLVPAGEALEPSPPAATATAAVADGQQLPDITERMFPNELADAMFPDDLSDIICRHYFISGGARSQRYLMKLEAERAFRKRCKARRLEREAREDRSYQVGLCVRASIFSVGMVAGLGLIGCFNGGDANHCSPRSGGAWAWVSCSAGTALPICFSCLMAARKATTEAMRTGGASAQASTYSSMRSRRRRRLLATPTQSERSQHSMK
jgi:hypothetical protein